jgi:hypothetical protein
MANELPYIIGYNAESIINWDSSKPGDDLGPRKSNWSCSTRPTSSARRQFAWQQVMRFRVLGIANQRSDVWPEH